MPGARRATSIPRAEARRRARRIAQRRWPEDEAEPIEEEPQAMTERRPSSLRMIFAPPVAPLPDKPHPLAGFGYRGPARGLVATLWLLGRNPLAWLVPGLVAAVMHRLILPAGGEPIGLLGSALLYGLLFGAGWFGWQRPWLFGAAASVLGYGLLVGYGAALATAEGQLGQTTGQEWLFIALQGGFWGVVGAVAGWFGGYHRRRRADPAYRRPPPGRSR